MIPGSPAISVCIHWFSGTGNARRAAEWIQEDVVHAGGSARLVAITRESKDSIPWPEPGAILGFCYPTHGFNAPPLVLRYLWRFPKGKNRVFLLNTRAGLKLSRLHLPGIGGLALWLPFLILAWKGYRVRWFRPLDLPSNWISLHPGLRAQVVTSIHRHCRTTIRNFSARLLRGQAVLKGLLWLPVDLITPPVAIAYLVYGRFMLAKTFFASAECTACGKCVRECPVGAIRMLHGRPYWTFSCESCMHCMNHCPEQAVQTSHGFTFLLWWLVFSVIPATILGLLLDRDGVWQHLPAASYEWLYIAIQILGGLAFVYPAYLLLHRALRYRWFNRLVTWTSLTSLPFWRRYRPEA